MSAHAPRDEVGVWREDELAELPTEDGFRLRGLETTRLDTFIDAAFAFVLTLLVISFDEIPDSLDEMIDAVKRIPAFAVSFSLIMMFWIQHRSWSRRFGTEDRDSVLLSLALIFVVLVWVFPLRSVFEGMFAALTGGWLPITYAVDDIEDLRVLFLFYSAGFTAMTMVMVGLFDNALRRRDALGLDAHEQAMTNISRRTWIASALTGAASLAIATFAQGQWVTLAGWIYWLMPFAIIGVVKYGQRGLRALDADATDEATT